MDTANSKFQILKNSIIIFLAFVLLSCSDSKTKNNIESKEGASNIIKIAQTKSYFIENKFGNVEVDDKVYEETEEQFNKEGKIIYKSFSSPLNALEKSEYIYDLKGNTEIITKNEDGTLKEKRVNKLNDKKQIIEQVYYNSSGSEESVFKFSYDSIGYLKTRKTYVKGKYKFTTNYKYDEKGNLLAEWQGSINEAETYKYLFDKKGNWIEAELYSSGEKRKIYKRNIEYW